MSAPATQFPVIPGEMYRPNYLVCGRPMSIRSKVLGFLPFDPENPELGPAVAYDTIGVAGNVIGDSTIVPLSVFQVTRLPLGQRMATTTALMGPIRAQEAKS